MPKQIRFGERPSAPAYVRVRVQEMSGGRVAETKSFAIYGEYSHAGVCATIEAALQEQFGSGQEVDEEEDQDDASVAAPLRKKVIRRAARRSRR